MPPEPTNHPTPNSFNIMWGAFVVNIFIFALVLRVLISNPEPNHVATSVGTMAIVMASLAVLEAALAWYFRIRFHKKLENHDYDRDVPILTYYYIPCLLSWAFCMSIAIYGFILVILSNQFFYYTLFGGAGLLLLLSLAPQTQKVMEKAEGLK